MRQDRREALVDEMNTEFRHAKSRLKYESILHKVIDDTYPAPRDGRGGGGWQFHPSDGLTKRTEKLVPAGLDFQGVRKDISLQPRGLDLDVGKADLEKMDIPSEPTQTRQSSARKSSHRSKRAPVHPLTAALEKRPVPHPHIQSLTSNKSPYDPNPYVNVAVSPYVPVPHPSLAAQHPPPQPPSQKRLDASHVSSKPLYYNAARNDPTCLTWEDYRALAKYDAWGCPLPHDRQRREMVLRESFEKMLGRIRKDTLQTPVRMIAHGAPEAETMPWARNQTVLPPPPPAPLPPSRHHLWH